MTADHRPLAEAPLDNLHLEQGTRPAMPALDGATDAHRKKGRHLAVIHRMHFRELSRVETLLTEAEDGKIAPTQFADALRDSALAQNMAIFGTLCGRACQVLHFHHQAEEMMMFPELEAADLEALNAVVARLKEEHLVVHELLARLAQASEALLIAPDSAGYEHTKAIFRQLKQVVISHFGYEETALEEAIGLYVSQL